MRETNWKYHKNFIRYIVFFIMGAYIGFFFCIINYADQIDNLMEKNEKLSLEIKNYHIESEALKKEIEERKQNKLVRSIKFHINDEIDSFSETELLEKLIDETHFLIGKEIADISENPDYIYYLLNQRIYEVNEKKYEIRVRFIYIQATTEIWIYIEDR